MGSRRYVRIEPLRSILEKLDRMDPEARKLALDESEKLRRRDWVQIISQEAASREAITPKSYGHLSSWSSNKILGGYTVRCEDGYLHPFRCSEFDIVPEGSVPESARNLVLAGERTANRIATVKCVRHESKDKETNVADRPSNATFADCKAIHLTETQPRPAFATVRCRHCKDQDGNPLTWPVRVELATPDGWISECRMCAGKRDKLGRMRKARERKSLHYDHPESPRLPGGMSGNFSPPIIDRDAAKREWLEKRNRVRWAEENIVNKLLAAGLVMDEEDKFILGLYRDGKSYSEISAALGAIGIKCSKPNVPQRIFKTLERVRRRIKAIRDVPLELVEVCRIVFGSSEYQTRETRQTIEDSKFTSKTYEPKAGERIVFRRGAVTDDELVPDGPTAAIAEMDADDMDSEEFDYLMGLDIEGAETV